MLKLPHPILIITQKETLLSFIELKESIRFCRQKLLIVFFFAIVSIPFDPLFGTSKTTITTIKNAKSYEGKINKAYEKMLNRKGIEGNI